MNEPKQLSWLPNEHARAADLNTSHAAAQSMAMSAKAIAGKVLTCLRDHGPATYSTIAERLRMQPAQVWRRISDLKNAKLIESTNSTAPGPSGRQQTIWRAL